MARCKALSTYWQENQKRGLYTIPPHAQPRTSWRFSMDFPVSGPFPRWPRRPTIPPQLLPVFRSITISRMLLPQQARAHGTMSVALSFASLRNTPSCPPPPPPPQATTFIHTQKSEQATPLSSAARPERAQASASIPAQEQEASLPASRWEPGQIQATALPQGHEQDQTPVPSAASEQEQAQAGATSPA